MDLFDKILALLKEHFTGVREDGLRQLASALALQAETEEDATNIVGKLTADKVEKFVKDWRKTADAEITKANSTFETSLKQKYDFIEKGQPKPEPVKQSEQNGGELTLDAVAKLIDQKMAAQNSLLQGLVTEKTAANRRGLLEAELDKAKIEGTQRDMILGNFARMTFKDDDDFNGYLKNETEAIGKLAQETANDALRTQQPPIFGAVNKDGVSEGVASYIAAKAAKPTLQGKEL